MPALDPVPARADVEPARARRLLAAILGLALLLRVVYVLQSRANPWFDAPEMDAGYHVAWARAFAAGQEFQPGPFFRAPLYPWFLGLVLRVLGDGLLAPRLVQAFVGSASCALVYVVGARAFDRRTGLLAALGAATYWILIYFDGELLLPVLEVPAALLVVILALVHRDRPSAWRAACCGFALGIAALVRPNFLVLAPCLAPWFVAVGASGVRARVTRLAAFAGSLALAIAPITLWNALAGHDRVLISSQGGANLWIGNNPASDGATAIVPGTRGDWWGGFEDTNRQAEALEGRTLRPSEVSAHYTRRALSFWREEPWRALRLWAWKARLFWTAIEIGNNQDERFYALRFGPILRYLPLGFALLAPLGLVGLALAARRIRTLWPLWIFVPAYAASVILFFVCARFRVPVLPFLIVFAAHALVWMIDVARSRRWIALGGALLAVGCLAWGTTRVPAEIDTTESKGLWSLGVAAERDGDPQGALAFYDASIAANPRHAAAHAARGGLWLRLGDPARAEASLRRALELDAHLVLARVALADVLTDQGRLDEARTEAVCLTTEPATAARGHYALGRIETLRAWQSPTETERSSGFARAREAFESSRARATSGAERCRAEFGLGEVERALGRQEAALAHYEAAAAALPEPDSDGLFWSVQARRLRTLLDLDRRGAATLLARHLRAQHGSDPRATEATRDILGH